MDDTRSNKLYGRYQLARNGFLPDHAGTIAYLRLCLRDLHLKASLRRDLAQDVDQAILEEQTPHGAITDRVPTTRPLLYSVSRLTIPMDTEELKGGA